MDALNYLHQVLEEKINNQVFYNECSVRITNPAAGSLFTRFRDDEAEHIKILQKEIAAIESKPFPVNIVLSKLKN